MQTRSTINGNELQKNRDSAIRAEGMQAKGTEVTNSQTLPGKITTIKPYFSVQKQLKTLLSHET